MAGLRNVPVRRSYDSGMSGLTIIDEFYIPCLGASVQYDRIAGYFSSAALAVAARGVSALLANGGRMRLIASPNLTPRDLAELRGAFDEDRLGAMLTDRIDQLDPEGIDDLFVRDHAKAMLWMLANDRLEIRLVVPVRTEELEEDLLFHQKIGIFTDAAGDSISFAGSVNETARAWTHNIENFKVFRNWIEGQTEYVGDDVETFDRYWYGMSDRGRTVALPQAVKDQLLKIAPKSMQDFDLTRPGSTTPPTSPAPTDPAKPVPVKPTPPPLRDYQRKAVDDWLDAGGRGILEMATGTGKTWVAISCAAAMLERTGSQLTVVAVPQKHLAGQWAADLKKAFPTAKVLEAHSAASGWQTRVAKCLADLNSGLREHVVVVATHSTAASTLGKYIAQVGGSVPSILFIGDECHGLGARESRKALDERYVYRLGLSATPDRLYDAEGTAVLHEFFGASLPAFRIAEALNTIDPVTGHTVLCPYEYHPVFVTLSGFELEEYVKLTQKIYQALIYSKKDSTPDEWLERFLFQRAKITKRAGAKIVALDRILAEIGDDLGKCLIYCLDSVQVAEVSELLSQRDVVFSHFDGDDELPKRFQILDNLANDRIQAVVAMKCLDEGVDVPSARMGIILASSTNPREFIQRRGRILRQAPGKTSAVVYDFAVLPNVEAFGDPALRKLELRIFRRELERIQEFAQYALNAGRTYARLMEIEQELRDAGFGFLEEANE